MMANFMFINIVTITIIIIVIVKDSMIIPRERNFSKSI